MRKRLRIAFAVLLLGIAAVLTWELAREKEPVYDSKPLSYWIRRPVEITNLGEAYTMAIPRLDRRALPILIEYLGIKDGSGKRLYLRLYLRQYPTLPNWIAKRLPRPMPAESVRFNSILALGTIGPDAKPAIPALIRILKGDPNPRVRFPAILALGRIGQKDESVRAALLGALADPNSDISLQAATALINDGASYRSQVAAVLRGNLTNSTAYCREWATNLLRRGGFHDEEGWPSEGGNGQPDGAANRSQPIGSGTNRTPSAAGSGG